MDKITVMCRWRAAHLNSTDIAIWPHLLILSRVIYYNRLERLSRTALSSSATSVSRFTVNQIVISRIRYHAARIADQQDQNYGNLLTEAAQLDSVSRTGPYFS